MARPRNFDTQTVVSQAMQQFWQKGFERTSMNDLVRATGLKPGSLYSAFGNKQALFLRTLDRYCDDLREALSRYFQSEKSARERLIGFYDFLIEAIAETHQGCFLVNTLFDPAVDEEALAKVSTFFREVENGFCELFAQARLEGELVSEQEPAILAKMMVCHIYGLRGYARTNAESGQLSVIKDAMLSSVFRSV